MRSGEISSGESLQVIISHVWKSGGNSILVVDEANAIRSCIGLDLQLNAFIRAKSLLARRGVPRRGRHESGVSSSIRAASVGHVLRQARHRRVVEVAPEHPVASAAAWQVISHPTVRVSSETIIKARQAISHVHMAC